MKKYKPKKPGVLKVASFLLFFGAVGYVGYLYRTEQLFPPSKTKNNSPKLNRILVTISGEVKNPGKYKLFKGSRIVDLIEKAGGLTEKADLSRINFTERIKSRQTVNISKKKGFFKKLGIGAAPKETYLNPPIEVEEVK
ncbi:MAG: SLBB domain-containing protein [Elusimicrobia bacterium]|nr:SLBB domain-containing protein [Elusimicrobiota bacterium]